MKDPANENRKLMLQMKENYGKFDGLAFTTAGVPMMLPNHSGIEVQTMQPKIVYLGKSTEEANNLITTMEDPVEKSENVFVLALGKLCPCGSTRKATVVEAEMEALGHTGSKNRYCNARKKLGILSEQKDDGYWWSRPEMGGKDDL